MTFNGRKKKIFSSDITILAFSGLAEIEKATDWNSLLIGQSLWKTHKEWSMF